MATEYDKGKAKAEAELAELYRRDTVGGEFEEDLSIARYRGFGLQEEEDGEKSANEAIQKASRTSRDFIRRQREVAQLSEAEYQEERAMRLAQSYSEVQARIKAKQASLQSQGKGVARGGVGGMARTMGLGIAWTSYTLQFLFGLCSLIFLGANATITAMTEGGIVGAVLSVVKKVLNFFVDLESFAPLQDLTFLFWGLSAVVALITFFGFLLWFTFTAREEIGGTPLALLATALTFACSILPVSNLFPWIVLWVLYVNLMATYRFAKNVTGVRNLFSKTG